MWSLKRTSTVPQNENGRTSQTFTFGNHEKRIYEPGVMLYVKPKYLK